MGWMLFLTPNQQCQSTEGISTEGKLLQDYSIIELLYLGWNRKRRLQSQLKVKSNKTISKKFRKVNMLLQEWVSQGS